MLHRYLKNQTDELVFTPFDDNEARPSFDTSVDRQYETVSLDYFNQQFIRLNEDQNLAIQTPLPSIILGAAGSGKTYVALSIMRSYIEQAARGESKRILYVTKEKNLANDMKRVWHDLTLLDETNHVEVSLLTYEQLMQHVQGPHPIMPVTSDERAAFNDWFGSLKSNLGVHLTKEQLIQEFRICSGYTQIQYHDLGQHQSACPTDERIKTYRLYSLYMLYLQQEQRCDPVFNSLPDDLSPAHRYDLIVVDEAQNLSLKQQDNLGRLAHHQAIAFCMDPLQNLQDQCAMRPLLEQKYWRADTGLGINTVYLRQTYRCSQQVASIVTALVHAKLAVMGKIDKEEEVDLRVDIETAPMGAVYLSPLNRLAEQHQTILDRATSNHFAVITRPEFIAEARDRFKTPLVFTPEQIQGLEYHTILAYHLFSDAESIKNLRRISSKLEGIEINSTSPHRAKQGENQNQDQAPWFNALYTAYTRAQHTLLICEEINNDNRLNNLRNWIAHNLSDRKQTPSPDTFLEDNSADWSAEMEQQLKKSNIEIARAIAEQHGIKEPASIQTDTDTTSLTPARTTTPEATPVSATDAPKTKSNIKDKIKKPPNLTRAQSIVLELLNQFDVKGKLSNFLNAHADKLADLLFNTKVKRPDDSPDLSLLQHIMQSEPNNRRFTIALNTSKKDFVTNTFIDKALEYNKKNPLPESLRLKILLKILITKNTDRLKTNSIYAWARASLEIRPIRSSLFSIEPKDLTCLKLIELFTKYNDLMSAEHLGEALTTNITSGDNDTPLYFLTKSTEGSFALKQLLSCPQGRNIIKNIPAEAWGRAMTARAGQAESISPLYRLATHPEGRALLQQLIEKNPQVIDAIPTEAWTRAVAATDLEKSSCSPLSALTATPEGVAIQTYIFSIHASLRGFASTSPNSAHVRLGLFAPPAQSMDDDETTKEKQSTL